MVRIIRRLTTIGAVSLVAASTASAQIQWNYTLYNSPQNAGDGRPYGAAICSGTTTMQFFQEPQFQSLCAPGLVGNDFFGAHFWASVVAPATTSYSFTMGSDDGATMYLDNSLIINIGGNHAPVYGSNTVNMAAGAHGLDVYFYEWTGGAYLDLQIDQRLINAPPNVVPEPASMILMASGLLAIGGTAYRRRQRS